MIITSVFLSESSEMSCSLGPAETGLLVSLFLAFVQSLSWQMMGVFMSKTVPKQVLSLTEVGPRELGVVDRGGQKVPDPAVCRAKDDQVHRIVIREVVGSVVVSALVSCLERKRHQ